MEYIIRHCPKCNGELHIPADMKSCICMFCGETFNPHPEETDIMQESIQKLETDYQEVLVNIAKLTENIEPSMEQFKRDTYSTCYEEYLRRGSSVLSPANRYYIYSAEKQEKIIEELTQAFLNSINHVIREKTKSGLNKLTKNTVTDQSRFFLAVYTVPMIRSLSCSFSEALASHLVESWNQQNPKYTFQKSDYDEIKKGFNYKGFCFITTAVCETMGKEDDCYELNAFRSFRDTYMLNSVEGKRLVDEYYQIAPAIVTFINMQPDYRERYHAIWKKYLELCLTDIQAKHHEECKKRYIRMVQDLKEEYQIHSSKETNIFI